MAGDWLKLEANTPEKEEVLAITARLGWDDADLTVGKLFRLWRWFDQHTTSGNAARVTPALLDRIIGVSGFCHAVQEAGWLEIGECGITLPKFERHNGQTAKSRALTAKRVANHKSNSKGNDQGNASIVSDALPREEKRREDIYSTDVEDMTRRKRAQIVNRPEGVDEVVWSDFLALRKAKKAPLTATALEGIEREAQKAGISLNETLVACCLRGWQGFKADWLRPDERPSRAIPNRQEAIEARNQAAIDTWLASRRNSQQDPGVFDA